MSFEDRVRVHVVGNSVNFTEYAEYVGMYEEHKRGANLCIALDLVS